ncbi:putative anthrax toxin receptor 1 [Apostichopus japonicus]|uniref:Putative anthrax toxin receptor 1 n=1 Tax=Stichopus japonicus TaxID=307972 RepID=A0A2G8K3F6_STIJA|nr:putative anthrax toxin receptor 1 [Apostichopus japonicus]
MLIDILAVETVRDEIDEALSLLREISPEGGTILSGGLRHATQQIELEGGNSASVIITLTDGLIRNDKDDSVYEADVARSYGSTVMAVRVGQSQIDDLLGVANPPSETHIFKGDTFDDLESIIAKIVNTSCVEVLSVTPDEVCANDAINVSISGNGFDKTFDTRLVYCNFKLNDTEHRVQPYVVTSTELLCESPLIPLGEFVEVQVSVNNISFVSSNVTISAMDCTPPNVLPIILGLLGGLLLLGLFLLWWFWNLLCCAVVLKDKPVAPAPPPPVLKPAPPPPKPETPKLVPGPSKVKSWPKVRWGTSGNTEAALHLERGKQASVVGVIDIETEGEMVPERPPSPSPTRAPPLPPLPPAPKKKGCCSWISETFSKILAPFRSLYDRLSLMRPQPGDKNDIPRRKKTKIH